MSNVSRNDLAIHDIVSVIVGIVIAVLIIMGYEAYHDYKYAKKAQSITQVRWNGAEIEYLKNGEWIQADQVRENRYRALENGN